MRTTDTKTGKKGPARLGVAVLALSAAAAFNIFYKEDYVEKAMIPTKGDRPTIGFGSTYHEDGTPVKMGERTDPVRALRKAQAHLDKEERLFRASLPGVELTQGEYDLYLDFAGYQYGMATWNKSSMRRHLLVGNYKQACDALLLYRRAGGYDCSTTVNGKPNRRCWGVWTRQLERHAKCVAEQG